jgi:hypothetical protein
MVANEIKNLLLRMVLLAFVLADINHFGIGTGQFHDFRAHQPVIENNVTLAENTGSFQRQEFGVARTGADQIELSRLRMNKWLDTSSLADLKGVSDH